MKIILGKQIEEIKKKDSENEKNLLKNRNSDELNEVDIDFRSNSIKNIKLGTHLVNRIYLNHSIVYELEDTIDLNLFHSLVPKATATSIIFDKLENQDISNFNLIGYCDANHHIAVYENNTEYLLLNIRNDYIYSPINSDSFFYDYNVLRHCVFHFFNTQNVTNMRYMFAYCRALTSIDVSRFDTSKVTDMSYMFVGCIGLTSLDLSNFNTQNVTNMRNMFVSCRGLTSINVSRFDTSKVRTMNAMFYDCSGLTRLDLSSFNTLNVIDIARMFSFSSLITSIIANSFKLSSLTTSADIFNNCVSLVGGNGTTYNSSYITALYARVDGENNLPGYFTAPAANNNK